MSRPPGGFIIGRGIGATPFPDDPDLCEITTRLGSVGDAGWSSPVARQAHNLKVVGSNPAPATHGAHFISKNNNGLAAMATPSRSLTTTKHY